jgi:hypothetical protein
MQGDRGGLRELVGTLYGTVSGFFLLIGILTWAKGAHHPVSFWLVVGSWMVTFAALSWGFRRRRAEAAAAPHLHLHGADTDYRVEGPTGDKWTVRSIGKESAPLPTESPEGLRGSGASQAE